MRILLGVIVALVLSAGCGDLNESTSNTSADEYGFSKIKTEDLPDQLVEGFAKLFDDNKVFAIPLGLCKYRSAALMIVKEDDDQLKLTLTYLGGFKQLDEDETKQLVLALATAMPLNFAESEHIPAMKQVIIRELACAGKSKWTITH